MQSAASVAIQRREKQLMRKQLSENGSCICHLDTNDAIGCWGAAVLTVREGSVSVWGFVLTKHFGSVDTAWIKGSVHAITSLENGTIVEFSSSIAKWSGVSHYVPMFKHLFPANHFHYAIVDPDVEDTENNIQELLLNPLQSWQDYSIADDSKGLVVIGPKSSGKSSLARLLVNSQISTHGSESVAYLELDPGQPEFGPPGTVSLNLLGVPLIGASFTWAANRRHTTVKSHFLGYTSPKDQPQLYISYVRDLMAAYRATGGSSFLVVNTPGWIKGLGHDLISEILDITGLSAIYLGSDAEHLLALSDRILEPITYSADSVNRVNAQDTRSLQMISYFHGINHPQPWQHLTEMTPYSIPLSKLGGVALWARDGVEYDQLNVVLSGTVVALIQVSEDALPIVKIKDGFVDETQLNPEFLHCLGYAVVQSIEQDESGRSSALRLIIPSSVVLSSAEPEKIIVARGRIQLSVYELWNPELDNSEAPYLSNESYGVGSQQWRVRRNIQRRAYVNGINH